MENTTARIIEKVQKLLALANNNANVNEAAAAAARAQELLFAHKLSMADVEIKTGEREAVGQMNVDEETALQLKWKAGLMGALARGCYCRVLTVRTSVNGKPVARMILIGKPSDTQTVAYLYDYVRNEIDRLCARQAAGRGFAYANSFRVGAVAAIADMMNAKRAEQERPTTSNETALVVVKRGGAEVDAFIGKAFPRLRTTAGARVSNGNAYSAGQAAGRSINLGGGGRGLGTGARQLR